MSKENNPEITVENNRDNTEVVRAYAEKIVEKIAEASEKES